MLQSGDEAATFEALADLTPALAVGTEESLGNVQIDDFARTLVLLLSAMTHNANIMLLAVSLVFVLFLFFVFYFFFLEN